MIRERIFELMVDLDMFTNGTQIESDNQSIREEIKH